MPKETKAQKETVERVMHEYKHGELQRGRGGKVTNPKQAIAIALHEAGASKYESSQKNQENLRKTKSRERRAATGQARAERRKPAGDRARGGSGDKTKAELYQEAKHRNVSGRSKMSKEQLARALNRR
jgi:hypothetical protein